MQAGLHTRSLSPRTWHRCCSVSLDQESRFFSGFAHCAPTLTLNLSRERHRTHPRIRASKNAGHFSPSLTDKALPSSTAAAGFLHSVGRGGVGWTWWRWCWFRCRSRRRRSLHPRKSRAPPLPPPPPSRFYPPLSDLGKLGEKCHVALAKLAPSLASGTHSAWSTTRGQSHCSRLAKGTPSLLSVHWGTILDHIHN